MSAATRRDVIELGADPHAVLGAHEANGGVVVRAFRPEAISRASATGVWQFMRGTALENGLRHDWYIDERSNPEKATLAAANYLKTLADTFDGDWQLALATLTIAPRTDADTVRSAMKPPRK